MGKKTGPRHGTYQKGPRTTNRSELNFLSLIAADANKAVLKRGWPDFLVVTDVGIYACEVKPGIFRAGDERERLKYEQTWVMSILKDCGIPCYVSDGRGVQPFDAKEHGSLDWLVDNGMAYSHEAVALRLRRAARVRDR